MPFLMIIMFAVSKDLQLTVYMFFFLYNGSIWY